MNADRLERRTERRRPRGFAGMLALLGVLAGAHGLSCGEDVDFSSGRPDDAGVVDAASRDGAATRGGDDAQTSDLPDTSATSDAAGRTPPGPGDAGCPFADAAAACRVNGSTCRSMKDCCSERCESGYCLQVGACAAPGAPCSTRSSCCSGRCEPIGRDGALACAQYCEADGARCAAAADCCSLACNGGMCGGAICSVIGTVCDHDVACCSNRCDSGRCLGAQAACLPTGEGCSDDGGAGGFNAPAPPAAGRCCSGFCNAETDRCDLGPGTCRESSAPCSVDSECCRGACVRNEQGEAVCTAPCLADGQDCNSNGDCCGGVCGGALSTCGESTPACP